MKTRFPLSLILSLILFLVHSVGCGLKAPPLPPEEFAPREIHDLRVYIKGEEVYLEWSVPTRRVDGSKLLDLAGFEIYRKEIRRTEASYTLFHSSAVTEGRIEYRLEGPPGESEWCKGSGKGGAADLSQGISFIKIPIYLGRDEQEEWESYQFIDRVYLSGSPDHMIYKDRGLSRLSLAQKLNRAYSYIVISFDRGNLFSRPSNRAGLIFHQPPPPPKCLFAQLDEARISLSWYFPGDLFRKIQGFNIYRREVKGDYPFYPLNDQLVRGSSFIDDRVVMGKTYIYAIRAVRGNLTGWQEGHLSNEALITVRDINPPKPPQGLVAIARERAIVLSWQPNLEPDLLGYRVYRKRADEVNYRCITPIPLTRTTFKDEGVVPGKTYFYRVTAIDQASPANESDFSEEIMVTPLRTR